MIKKKVKRIIGVAITLALASNSIGFRTTVNAAVEGENSLRELQAIEGDFIKNPSNSNQDFKISKDIDTASDEVISVIVEFVSEPIAGANKKRRTRSVNTEKMKVERDHTIFEEFLATGKNTSKDQVDGLDQVDGVDGAGISADYKTPEVEIKNSYTKVFNGVSLNIKASDIEKLFECGVVKRVHKDAQVFVDPPVENEVKTGKVETNEIEPYMMESLPYLGVDKLHEEGIKGQGIKVGVLDTGIDYNHPDLTNAYEGFRAEDGDKNAQDINSVKGWDFIDNDADPMETTYADWKGSGQPEFIKQKAYYTAHGTHVSGTIAAQRENNESDLSVLGIAPEVELYGYRVLGPYGSGATSGIIAAIEKAIADGMDVINMSLGDSDNNSPFDPMVVSVNNAMKAGVVTVISNGNDGPESETVGSPGTAPLPIAVGASTVDFNYDTYSINLGELGIKGEVMSKDLENSFADQEGKELEIVYCGLGKPEDFEGKDVAGKVVYVERGEIALVDKVINAKKNGAAFAIMSNNVDMGRIAYLGEIHGANTIAISKADGEKLKENLDKKLSITSTGNLLVEGDEVTSFSSVGPVKETYDIRPDVVAPGAQVFSTVPEYINDKDENVDNYKVAYQRMSGTSMAAPHITGIAALVLQENPDYTPEDVKAAIMNTSEHIHRKDGMSYSVHEIGAGRVNPVEAVKERVSFKAEYDVLAGENEQIVRDVTGMLSYGKLIVDDREGVEKRIPVTVSNNTSEDKTYKMEVEYSDSERAKDAISNGIVLKIPTEVIVKANDTSTFDVTIEVPNSAELGNYEGYVHVKEAGGSQKDYQLPFGTTVKKVTIAKVRNLNAVATNNSISINWTEPESTDELVGYVIYKDGKAVETVPASVTSYELKDLKANKIHGIKVTAKYSNNKESKPTSINIRTKK